MYLSVPIVLIFVPSAPSAIAIIIVCVIAPGCVGSCDVAAADSGMSGSCVVTGRRLYSVVTRVVRVSHFAAACRTGTCTYSPESVCIMAVGLGCASDVFGAAPVGCRFGLVGTPVMAKQCVFAFGVLGIIVVSSVVSVESVSHEVSDCSMLGTAKLKLELDPMAWSKRATDMGKHQ